MGLTDTDVKKFRKLYKQHFGVLLGFGEAQTQGLHLLNMVASVYQPITTTDYKNLYKDKNKNDDRKRNRSN